MKVVIAEDEAIARLLLKKAVEKLGHECRPFKDGASAWNWYRENGADVVISDRMMPGMDGIELCCRVRAHPTRYTYFILLTGLGDREHRIEGMKAGADDYLSKPLDRDELALRLIAAERVTNLHAQLHDQQQELERLNKKFYEQGRIDALTGIANRLQMQEDLTALDGRVRRHGHSYCVALLDVDHFKKYNDTAGHLAGDRALQTVAAALARTVRSSDGAYRYGGEEFCAVFPEQSLDTARIAGERIRAAVERCELEHPGKPGGGVVTVSVGVAQLLPGKGLTMEDVLRHADEALYRAKEGGRNKVEVYGMPEVVTEEPELVA